MESEVNLMFPYLFTFGFSAVCFGIATWIANATLYRPDSSDIKFRKMWFWIMFAISVIIPLGVNFGVATDIEVQHDAYLYLKHSCIADIVFAVIYILVGLIVSKSLSTKKVGSWFK